MEEGGWRREDGRWRWRIEMEGTHIQILGENDMAPGHTSPRSGGVEGTQRGFLPTVRRVARQDPGKREATITTTGDCGTTTNGTNATLQTFSFISPCDRRSVGKPWMHSFAGRRRESITGHKGHGWERRNWCLNCVSNDIP